MDLDFHDVLLTPSDVLEHMFCGRFTYFERHLAHSRVPGAAGEGPARTGVACRAGGDQPIVPEEAAGSDGKED